MIVIGRNHPVVHSYYRGTFTTNNVTDGSVTFNFNGTAVWIYGSRRPHHGSYTVQVDSATYSNLNSTGDYPVFQQVLFNASTLSQGMHSLVLTNTASGGLYVIIDMVSHSLSAQVLNARYVLRLCGNRKLGMKPTSCRSRQSRTPILAFNIKNQLGARTQPQVSLTSPCSAMALASKQYQLLSVAHLIACSITQPYNASVTFTFIVSFSPLNLSQRLTYRTGRACCSAQYHPSLTHLPGEAISLFGTSGPSNGPYSAQLDGGQTVQYNASNAYPTNYGVIIYHADNLGAGSHQLILTNLPAASGQSLSIDYAQLWAIARYFATDYMRHSLCRPNSIFTALLLPLPRPPAQVQMVFRKSKRFESVVTARPVASLRCQ